MSSALASFSRLSPSRIVRIRCGGRNGRSTAVAATASGGATTAPSAIAAAHGIVGMSVWTTTATAAVVNPTANTTRLVTGSQLSRRSLSDASYAASSRTGATNSASASSGATVDGGRAGEEGEGAPAARQEHRVGCADAAPRGRQDYGRDEQAEKLFEVLHRCRFTGSCASARSDRSRPRIVLSAPKSTSKRSRQRPL